MNADNFFKPFPEYEDVFYGDIEQYKKHFLPICSINLKFLDPNRDEWFHFVSVKEIYDGQIGQNTQEFHTQYCKPDMIGFDIIDGKYKLEADWNYFEIEQIQKPEKTAVEIIKEYRKNKFSFSEENLAIWLKDNENYIPKYISDKILKKHNWFINSESEKDFVEATLDRIEKEATEFDKDNLSAAYTQNETAYLAGKEYFKKYGKIYGSTISNFSSDPVFLEDLEKKDEKQKKNYPEYKREYPEFFGFLDDIQFTSKENKNSMSEYDISLEEMQNFDNSNLIEKPYDAEGNIFEYIGCFTGYFFQKYGADSVYLFYNKDLKKAVICFEYT